METSIIARDETDRTVFIRVWAILNLLLLLVTWRLWFAATDFPAVAMFAWLVEASVWLDRAFAVSFVIGLMVLITFPACWSRRMLFVLALTLAVSIALNQHRLQPWAWHALVFAMLIGISSWQGAKCSMRWILVSVYCYSAISKFDYQFSHTVGLQLLDAMLNLVGVSIENWSPRQQWLAIQLFPVGELAIGIGLLIPRARRTAAVLAIGLHVLLILILGPFGLKHQLGVLVWNTMFIFQVYWLFWRTGSDDQVELRKREIRGGKTNAGWALLPVLGNSGKSAQAMTLVLNPLQTRAAEWIGRLVTTFVLFFPATASLGICDHWLAWELYAPRSSRVEITLPKRLVQQLPESARNHVVETEYPGVVELDLGSWSLGSLQVPIYPQARFQLGVAKSLADRLISRRDMRVTIVAASDRWTGIRNERVINMDGFLREAERFGINADPRTFRVPSASKHPP